MLLNNPSVKSQTILNASVNVVNQKLRGIEINSV